MKHRQTIPFFLALLVIAAAVFETSCAARRAKAYDGCVKRTMRHEDRSRSYILCEPRARDGRRLPLLLALHGGGGDAGGMIKLTRGRFNELAERDGFLVVYPEGVDRHWNDLRSGVGDSAHRSDTDDAGFLSALIDLIVKEKNADPGRVFATGISNGGFMSFRLACELSSKIKGVAAVTASLPAAPRSPCAPSRPVPVLLMNGTADPLVPYAGGPVRVLGIKRGEALSTDETVKFWTARNGCAGSGITAELPDTDKTDGSRVIKTVYRMPGGDPGVILYRIEGGGHTWPGGWQYLGRRFIGATNRDINACDEIWNFFRKMR